MIMMQSGFDSTILTALIYGYLFAANHEISNHFKRRMMQKSTLCFTNLIFLSRNERLKDLIGNDTKIATSNVVKLMKIESAATTERLQRQVLSMDSLNFSIELNGKKGVKEKIDKRS